MKFFHGDKVVYRGSRFSDLRNKLGEVCSQVGNNPDCLVVEFGDDSYVMPSRVLARYKPSKEPGSKEPEVQTRRKRRDEDDE